MWNNLHDILFSKKIRGQNNAYSKLSLCKKVLEIILFRKKSQGKGNVDGFLRKELRIWWETFCEYHCVQLEF